MLHTRQAEPLFPGSTTVLDKLLSLDRLRDLYQAASATDRFHQNLLSQLKITSLFNEIDLARIPRTGPVIVVANHPFGMLEGSILGTILPRVRMDYKIMTNKLLACMPELGSHCIFVDAFPTRDSASRNGPALRDSLRWLLGGHMLVIFPAGEVSHWNPRTRAIQDPNWNDIATRLIRKTGSATLPIYFKGVNSVPFHLLGLVHPRLRTARLPHELFNKRGKTVEVRVGAVIPFNHIAEIPDDAEATLYLRNKTYQLSQRGEAGIPARKVLRHLEPIAPAGCKEVLASELHRLHPGLKLADSADFSVYMAEANQIPNVVQELGRLRELTFRQVGEGTGKSRDLDRFDEHYEHLVLWNKTDQEIAGAYRVGNVNRLLSTHGIQGLYTSTLFQYDAEFFRKIGPALELGRSFVRQQYQKRYAPLLLLWKGLARYVFQHPEAPTLFGAVSISSEYTLVSRRLIARYLEKHNTNRELAKLVHARKPFVQPRNVNMNDLEIHCFVRDLDSLSDAVQDMEWDGKAVPILLKQYLKLGGKLLGLSLDPRFGNTLDGLLLVNLRDTEQKVLERYMGREQAALFLAGQRAALADATIRQAPDFHLTPDERPI